MPSEKRARQRAAREARLAAEAQRKKNRNRIRNGIIVVVVAGVIVAIAFIVSSGHKAPQPSKSDTSTTVSTAGLTGNAKLQAEANNAAVEAGCPASPKTRVNDQHYSSAPPMTIDTSKTYTATVKTTVGTFVITLDAKTAPKTVNNFVFLAGKGYFNCNTFARVIPDFVNQTGDPTGTTKGGPGYSIPDELPAQANPQYPLGSVAMANSGPNTGGSQFFVVAGSQGETLQPNYSLFGQVTSGMDVVSTINKEGSTNGIPPDVTQRMLKVTISSS